jgi:hypothetical protein
MERKYVSGSGMWVGLILVFEDSFRQGTAAVRQMICYRLLKIIKLQKKTYFCAREKDVG